MRTIFLNGLWYKPETLWVFLNIKGVNFKGVTYLFPRGTVKKKEFGYVGTVFVAEVNIYMYQKLEVLRHLTLPKDYVAYFGDQKL